MTRRGFLSIASAALQRPRPNIIFLLLDDLGWRDFGCYGNRINQTPNTDQLAAESVRFTDAYAACPVCSPTRASILTGKYPARLHLTDWIPGRRPWPHARLLTPAFEQQLPLREVTIAEALKPIGYRTASIGKWHLGGEGFHPEQQGFDLNIAGDHRGSVASYFGPFNLPGLKGGSPDEYLTERLTAAAERFIRDCAASRQPFFLYLPEYTVHLPLNAREAAIARYRARGAPEPAYSAMVESFDVALGRIRTTLVELGISGNTILFVTSDNGGVRFQGSRPKPVTDNSPLRSGKGHLFEGGIREPLIIHWPGITRPGRVVRTPVSSIDFFPTILDMAGAPKPREVDGVSLTGLLRGQDKLHRDALFWHYPHYSDQGGVPSAAIRRGDWKLIEFYEDRRLELFHLKRDIGERVNLAERHPRIAADLKRRLDDWRRSVDAAMPQLNPDYDPSRASEGLTGYEPVTRGPLTTPR